MVNNTSVQFDSKCPEPTSIEDALTKRDRLSIELRDIEAQLSQDDPRDSDGNPFDDNEYESWRKRAIGAIRFKQARIALLKKWIREHKRFDEAPLGFKTALSLLRDATKVFGSLEDSGVALSESELRIVEAIRGFLLIEKAKKE